MYNNPLIPGDPYMYDVKWIIAKILEHSAELSNLDEKIRAAVIAALNQHDPIYFESADALINSGIKAGALAYIEGYYAPGDGGANLYITTDNYNDIIGANFYITLSGSNKWAIPIILTPFVTPEMFGAKGDGTTDDSGAINNAFSFDKNIIFAKKKTYLISANINSVSNINVDFNNSTILFDTSFASWRINGIGHACYINGNFEAVTTVTNHKAIDITGSDFITVENMNIINFGGDGVYINDSDHININNCIASDNQINFFAFESTNIIFEKCVSNGGTFKYNCQLKSCTDSAFIDCIVNNGTENSIFINTQSTSENPNPVISARNRVINCAINNHGDGWTPGGGGVFSALFIQGEDCAVDGLTVNGTYYDGLRCNANRLNISNVVINNVYTTNQAGMRIYGSNIAINNVNIFNSVGYGMRIYADHLAMTNVIARNITQIAIDLQGDFYSLTNVHCIADTILYNRGINISASTTTANINAEFYKDSNLGTTYDFGGTIAASINFNSASVEKSSIRGNIITNPFTIENGKVHLKQPDAPTSLNWLVGDTTEYTDPITKGYLKSIFNGSAWVDICPIS